MPVQYTDFSNVSASEQELIWSHVQEPDRFMTPMIFAVRPVLLYELAGWQTSWTVDRPGQS